REIVHIHFPDIDSTNSWAKINAQNFEPGKITLITAEKQRDGKGRQGRKWISPAGENLYATIVFQIPDSLKTPGSLTQVLAVTTARLLEDLGYSPQIKWPNDLLINGKKVAGILAELVTLAEGPGIAMGIGLNVNMPPHTLASIGQAATSLVLEEGENISIQELGSSLASRYAKDLELFFSNNPYSFHSDLDRFNLFKNKIVSLDDGGNLWKGRFTSLNPDGSIQIEIENNKIKTFYSGDISLVLCQT
ncbi:MAG: BirA family biotin operon repressor/biotin-[acetyl-CoA-carboxylase] ligase, partial [Chlamydiales bacterium]